MKKMILLKKSLENSYCGFCQERKRNYLLIFSLVFSALQSIGQTYSPANAYIEDFNVGGRIIEFGAPHIAPYSIMFSSGLPFYNALDCSSGAINTCGSGNHRIQSASITINTTSHAISSSDLIWKECSKEFQYTIPNNIYIQDGDSIRFTIVLCGTVAQNGGYNQFQTPFKKATKINHNFNPTYDPCTKQATFNFTYQDRVIAYKYGSQSFQIGLTHNGTGLPAGCFENNPITMSKRPSSSTATYSNPTTLSLVNPHVPQGTETAISSLLTTPGELVFIPTNVTYADLQYGQLKFFLDGNQLKFWDNLSGLYTEDQFSEIPGGPGNQTWTGSDQLRIKSTNSAYELWKNSNLLYSVSKLVTFSTNAPNATMNPINGQVLPGQTIDFDFSATLPGTYDVFIEMGTIRLKETFVVYSNVNPLASASVCQNSQISAPDPDGTVQSGTWASSNSSIATINATGQITGLTPGTATITYTQNGSACQSSFQVTVNPLPVVNLNGSNKLCLGETRLVTADLIPGTWASTNPNVATINSSGLITPVDFGNTTIQYTHTATGCMNNTDLTQISVHGFKNTVLNSPQPSVLCNTNDSLDYSVSTTVSGGSTLTYQWFNPANSVFSSANNATVTTPGNHSVTLNDGHGCEVDIPFTVDLFDNSVFGITGSNEVCADSTNGFVTASGGDSYVWIPSNLTGANINNAGPGFYQVVITDNATNCFDTLSYTVDTYENNHSAPVASNDSIVLMGDITSGSVNVVNNDAVSSNYGLIVISQGSHGTGTFSGDNLTYSLSSTPTNALTDNVTYSIFDATCPSLFSVADVKIIYNIIPRFVSPWTLDGKNDTWDIHMAPSDNVKVTIMNRWGDVFFETTNYNNDWAGQSNTGLVLGGNEATPGTYFFVIRIEDQDVTIKGALELVK